MKYKIKDIHTGEIYLPAIHRKITEPALLTQKEIAELIALGYAVLFEPIESKKKQNDSNTESTE